MILPMKKLTLLVLDSEKEAALKTLRNFGSIHVEKEAASSERLSELQGLYAKFVQAESLITEAMPKKAATGGTSVSREKLLTEIDTVLQLKAEQADTMAAITKLSADVESYGSWGNFEPADIKALESKGLYLIPGELSEKSYAVLPETVKTIRLAGGKKAVRCVICSEKAELPADIPAEFRRLVLPECSLAAMHEELGKLKALLPSYQQKIGEKAFLLDTLKAEAKKLSKDIEFETIHAGMAVIPIEGQAGEGGNVKIARLSGYVLAEKYQDFTGLAKANGWAFAADDPDEDDVVPTALRHNRFVRLLTPLTDFLGTVPGYREPDISLWFLLFFGIFFAMIFGDAGYGAILVLLSVLGIGKARAAGKPAPLAMQMFLYLGVLTVVWGTMVCNWFGMPVEYVPEFLRQLSVPAISNITEESVRNANLMQFCFTLGLLQLSIGHVICIMRNIKSPQVLGHIGSIAMLAGMYVVVLSLVVSAERYQINQPVLLAVGVGFALNFIFSNYQTGIGQSILESLKNIITMFLGVVNVFADIMSYIRLWAVGLAGSAISATVNQMAGPALGSFLIFLGILLLFFGHGLNYIMNVLSVIVHGVRLNTLEFSNHVGLTWAGFKYEPFSE